MPIGPNILCPLNARKVDLQRAHVDRQVRHRLAGIEHDERADRVRAVGELADRVDRAEHVGHVGERDDLGARR